MSTAAVAGSTVFDSLDCASCHSGGSFTDSSLGSATLHDVGTLRTTSGNRLGGPLTGIDTPTLLGVWDTAPYFHDGSAATLNDVFVVAGGMIVQAETGAVSGNALIVSQFVDLNNDDTVHNRSFVAFGGSNARLTMTGIDGGPGGVGALELRYSIGNPTMLNVTVNGVLHSVTPPSVGNSPTWIHVNWGRLRIEGVTFNPGTANTIVFATPGMFPNVSLDDVLISTADELAAAEPHRRALGLSASDRADLIAYLRELDSRGDEPGSAPTTTPTPAHTHTPSHTFTPSHPPTLTDTSTPTLTPEASATPDAPAASPTATLGVNGVCRSGIAIQKPRLRMSADPFRLRFVGRATLPKPWLGVNPLTNGVRVVISDADEANTLDLLIPGGALSDGVGWTANRAGTRWRYTDPAGTVGGITRLSMRDRSKAEDGSIVWSVRAGGGMVSLPDVDSLRTEVVLGTADECAAIDWNPPDAARPNCQGDPARMSCD